MISLAQTPTEESNLKMDHGLWILGVSTSVISTSSSGSFAKAAVISVEKMSDHCTIWHAINRKIP